MTWNMIEIKDGVLKKPETIGDFSRRISKELKKDLDEALSDVPGYRTWKKRIKSRTGRNPSFSDMCGWKG